MYHICESPQLGEKAILTSTSGILLLQQHYWQQPGHESDQVSTRNIFPETISALETLVRISATLREGGYELSQHLEDGRCSLFLVELVYQGMLVLLRMGQVWLAEDVQSKKESLAWLLSHMEQRWPIVGKIMSRYFNPS